MKPEALAAFLARFFPTFLLSFFTAVFGISICVALWGMLHWRDPAESGWYSLALGGGLAVVLSVGHFFMIRGFAWAVYLIWAALVATLLIGLSLLGSRAPQLLAGVGVVLPLVSILSLNSRRHREMRARLIEIGIERRRS
ncbi:hypothetical protein [Pseudomonas sp.]|uniref:hypothetical protein n=1 Tax=Pseudomonas sp. TaxID=306 RepID=UPI0028A760CD|nr:hypothetical protein [Pseudomonas sp.]